MNIFIDGKKMQICDKEKCTACNACANICPKGCIRFSEDDYAVKYADIDEEICIHCGLCKKVCPQLNDADLNTPQKCYAAWSNDANTRKNAASGGVASELSKHWAKKGGYFTGVVLNDSFQAEFILTNQTSVLSDTTNSKYVYSDTKNIYSQVAQKLKDNFDVLFIGLPCQVEGLKKYLGIRNIDTALLTTVDLVCHGVTPEKYLQQHVDYLKHKYRREIKRFFFRDPKFNTHSYMMSAYDNSGLVYARKVDRNDTYQLGYHKGIAFRENCYSCQYAKTERTGDITLADFAHVGSVSACEYDNQSVSCVLINTEKGKEALFKLIESNAIYAEERPLEEEINYEGQLHSATKKPEGREKFLKRYKQTINFDKSVYAAACKDIIKNEIGYYLHIRDLKKIIKSLLPEGFIQSIKCFILRKGKRNGKTKSKINK